MFVCVYFHVFSTSSCLFFRKTSLFPLPTWCFLVIFRICRLTSWSLSHFTWYAEHKNLSTQNFVNYFLTLQLTTLFCCAQVCWSTKCGTNCSKYFRAFQGLSLNSWCFVSHSRLLFTRFFFVFGFFGHNSHFSVHTTRNVLLWNVTVLNWRYLFDLKFWVFVHLLQM